MGVWNTLSKRDKQLIISTFLFGIFTGFFLYVTVYAPNYGDGLLPKLPVNQAGVISVTGVMYGACLETGLTCPSFELGRDGVLRSIGATPLTEPEVVEVIELPRALMNDIRRQLQSTDWATYTEPRFGANCGAVQSDEYRYVVTLGEATYIVDTCATEFPLESELNQTLQTFFVK